VKPRALVAALALALVAAAIAVHPKAQAGTPMRDFEAYYAAGTTWFYHGDPYGRDIWRIEKTVPGVAPNRDELLPFVGPPFSLPMYAAIAHFGWPAASLIWGTSLGLALGVLVFASLRAAGGTVDALDVFAVALFAACFGPLTSGLALGQAAVLACAAIALAPLVLGPRRTFAAAGSALVAALQPNLAVALLASAGTRRAAIAFALAIAVAAGGSALALGALGGIPHYLDVLREHAASERFIAIQTTVPAVARAFGAAPHIAGALALGAALATLGVLAFQLVRMRYGGDARLALACAALPLALPFSHEHDFTLAFFPAIVVMRRARGGAWILAALASLAIAVDWLGLAQRPNAVAFTALLAAAAALALAALVREPLRPMHFLPLAIVPAVALAALAGAAHPLPTWPDTLPAHFSVPPSFSAADVWRAEQLASGIGALDWRWALLRAFSLAGCAMLWSVASYVLLRAPETAPNSAPSSIPLGRQQAAHPSA
jgi:hypothetical protein